MRTHGIKGNLLIRLDGKGLSRIEALHHIFLQKGSSFIPYRIETIKKTFGEQFHLHLKGVLSKYEASKLIGSELYLSAEYFNLDDWTPEDLLGFSLRNQNGKILGILTDFISNGALMWFEVQKEELVFLVPFNEDLVLEIDEETEVVILDLPEGLDEL